MNRTRILYVILAMLSLALVSCSSSTPDPAGTGQFGSTSPGGSPTPTPTPTPQTGQVKVAQCNGFQGSGNLLGRIKSYYDSFNVYDSRWVYLKYNQMPLGFATSDNTYIEFFRIRVSPTGTVEQDTTPMQFAIEIMTGSGPVRFWYGPNQSGQNIGFNRQALYSRTGSQDANILLQQKFLIAGTDASLGYQILQAAVKDYSSGTGTVVGYANLLLTGFDSNPNRYATTHNDYLNQIHPNWARRSEGWDDANFFAFTQQYCF